LGTDLSLNKPSASYLQGSYQYSVVNDKVFVLGSPDVQALPLRTDSLSLIEIQRLPLRLESAQYKDIKVIPLSQSPEVAIQPHELRAGPAGTFYLSDPKHHRIWTITLNSDHTQGELRVLAGSGVSGYKDGKGSDASFNVPTALSFDGAGNLFVADTANHAIRKVTPAGFVTTFYKTPNP
jgi:hypothetical protein